MIWIKFPLGLFLSQNCICIPAIQKAMRFILIFLFICLYGTSPTQNLSAIAIGESWANQFMTIVVDDDTLFADTAWTFGASGVTRLIELSDRKNIHFITIYSQGGAHIQVMLSGVKFKRKTVMVVEAYEVQRFHLLHRASVWFIDRKKYHPI